MIAIIDYDAGNLKSVQKALEVYDMKDRTAYSKEIYQILDDAGLSEE